MRWSRSAGLVLVLAAGVVLAASARSVSAAVPMASAAARAESDAAAAIVAGTNRFRSEQGLGALEPKPRLTAAAAGLARHMARTGSYDHDADGRPPHERITAQGYDWCVVLENIAYAQSSAGFTTDALVRRLMAGWKQSPGHRRNLLEPNVDETGVGLAQSERTGRWYAVQVFARPRSRAVAFSVGNPTPHAVRYRTHERAFVLEPGATRTHTQCEPSRLVFEAGSGQPEVRLDPKPGEHWEVRDQGAGRWHLERVPR